MKSLKGVGFVVAAAAAVLVPLYGDPRQTPVTHPEWAHMLLRALDMEAVLTKGSSASLVFDSLSWRASVGIDPDKPFRSTGVEFLAGPPRLAHATASAPGELGYRLAVPRPGDYRVRLKLSGERGGDLAPGVALELTPDGETVPTRSLTLAPSVVADSGGIYLSPGVYTLSLALPPAMSLESIEVVPPCVNSIEPRGGWQPTATAQTGDVAVTALKALDLESELPPAASPIDVPGLAFQETTPRTQKASHQGGLEGSLQADANGLQAVAHVNLPEPGLYTVYGYGLSGGGQSWVADACHKSVLCPSAVSPETPSWKPLMTAEFSEGPHTFGMTLANGAAVQRLRLERKKDSVADYLATLARLGLDLGAQRPITRAQAADAMKFVQAKRRSLKLSRCGDVVPPAAGVLVAGLLTTGGAATTSPGTTPAGPGPGPEPGGGPLLPLPAPNPQPTPVSPSSPEPSPVPSPVPTPVPTPQPSPAATPSPSPSVGPPPTTLPQPPASPVKD